VLTGVVRRTTKEEHRVICGGLVPKSAGRMWYLGSGTCEGGCGKVIDAYTPLRDEQLDGMGRDLIYLFLMERRENFRMCGECQVARVRALLGDGGQGQ
jgi:hypothetical protein